MTTLASSHESQLFPIALVPNWFINFKYIRLVLTNDLNLLNGLNDLNGSRRGDRPVAYGFHPVFFNPVSTSTATLRSKTSGISTLRSIFLVSRARSMTLIILLCSKPPPGL